MIQCNDQTSCYEKLYKVNKVILWNIVFFIADSPRLHLLENLSVFHKSRTNHEFSVIKTNLYISQGII